MRKQAFVGAVVGLAGVSLIAGERARPLRMRAESDLQHAARNLLMAASAGIAIALFEQPLVEPLSRRVLQKRQGLVQQLPIPPWARDALAVALMDYTLYLWHVLTHKVPVLWRIHRVHHADRDMDMSTALRFHPAEMLASVPWRLAQVRLIGTSPRALKAWQRMTFASILFHHSNLRLPRGLEARLMRFMVTPRLHHIHHSRHKALRDSNWSSGPFSLWDRLHGTLRVDARAEKKVRIGVKGVRSAGDRLGRLMAMPVQERPPDEG